MEIIATHGKTVLTHEGLMNSQSLVLSTNDRTRASYPPSAESLWRWRGDRRWVRNSPESP